MVNGNGQKQKQLVMGDTFALFGGKVLILPPELVRAILESSAPDSGRVNSRVLMEKLGEAINASKS